MIQNPIEIVKWRDAVISARDLWSNADAAITTAGQENHRGTLFEPEPASYTLPDSVCLVVAGFLNARDWTSEAQRSRAVPKYTIRDIRTRCANLRSWRGFRTNGDKGFLCWRTMKSGKELERRDSSWAAVSICANAEYLPFLIVSTVGFFL